MKLLSIVLVVTVAAVIYFAASRRLGKSSTAWKGSFMALQIAGLALGFWLLTRMHYESPTIRHTGYPFPIFGWEFYNERWLGGPAPYFIFAAVADLALGLLVFLAPFRGTQWVISRYHRPHDHTA
jgi:hypothetical protein